MLCPSCSKLAILVTKRICVRCNGTIYNNISCICDNCSNEQKICSTCLKKLSPPGNNNRFKPSCRSCGK